jgi:hypothetical protein
MVNTSPQQKKEKKRFPSKINVSVSPISNAPPPSKVTSKGTFDPGFNFLTFLGWNISSPVFRPVLWIFLNF